MKTLISTALLLSLLTAAPGAWADTQQLSGPFSEGTTKIVLTQAERDNLVQYINKSKTALQEALASAEGKSLAETSQLYLKAIRTIVIDSYQGRQRSELLMRFILNQALELSYGVPTADGKSYVKRGVLQDSANQDLMTVILEDSIRLALNYVQDDFDAIKTPEKSSIDLAYSKMASQRLALASGWLASVLENDSTMNLYSTVLQQWLNCVAQGDSLHQAKLAVELSEVDTLLKDDSISIDPIDERVRNLRRKFKWLLAKVSPASPIATRVIRSETASQVQEPTPKSQSELDYENRQGEVSSTLERIFALASGKFKASYFDQYPNGQKTISGFDVHVESQLFNLSQLNRHDWTNGWLVLPFETTVRIFAPVGTNTPTQVQLQQVKASILQFVDSALGTTVAPIGYAFEKLNFNAGIVHDITIGDCSIKYQENIAKEDGLVELVLRGNLSAHVSFVEGTGDQQFTAMLGATAGGGIGVRIAKRVLLEALASIRGDFSADFQGSNLVDYKLGGKADLEITDWLHINVTVLREGISITRYAGDPQAGIPLQTEYNQNTAGEIATFGVEVKW